MGTPVIKPSHITRSQAITDIIKSVALEQAALAHILEGEAEKLKKVMHMHEHGDLQSSGKHGVDLLKVNKSVTNMVDSVSMLELILKSKLALFGDCLCEEKKENPHPHPWPCCQDEPM